MSVLVRRSVVVVGVETYQRLRECCSGGSGLVPALTFLEVTGSLRETHNGTVRK